MTEPQADTDSRPAWARIGFPSGWSSDRVQALNLGEFSELPEEILMLANFPFTSDYTKVTEFHFALLEANKRPPTPPPYVPSGWTDNRARGFDFDLVDTLSEQWPLWRNRVIDNESTRPYVMVVDVTEDAGELWGMEDEDGFWIGDDE
ncbi:Uu.00g065270.m01.CDS01 [Anthostomella pinea]|uniref:Uu.00g065270.m01.CDS01 n=1 Tax=Anthostomella pinea TaxID=933095 RepID=A0AAI8VTP9_9PEZI|nr:Uu.00g065270.m01.CDS01 [Anthostomella pinea]